MAVDPTPTPNLEDQDFISRFIPPGTHFIWLLRWGLSNFGDPAGSYTTSGIVPSFLEAHNPSHFGLHEPGLLFTDFILSSTGD